MLGRGKGEDCLVEHPLDLTSMQANVLLFSQPIIR